MVAEWLASQLPGDPGGDGVDRVLPEAGLAPPRGLGGVLAAQRGWTSPRWPDTVAMRPGLTVAGARDGAAVPTPAAAGSRWWSAADGRCTRRSSGRSRPVPQLGCGSGSGRPARP